MARNSIPHIYSAIKRVTYVGKGIKRIDMDDGTFFELTESCGPIYRDIAERDLVLVDLRDWQQAKLAHVHVYRVRTDVIGTNDVGRIQICNPHMAPATIQ